MTNKNRFEIIKILELVLLSCSLVFDLYWVLQFSLGSLDTSRYPLVSYSYAICVIVFMALLLVCFPFQFVVSLSNNSDKKAYIGSALYLFAVLVDVLIFINSSYIAFIILKSIAVALYAGFNIHNREQEKQAFLEGKEVINSRAFIVFERVFLVCIILVCVLYVYYGPYTTLQRYPKYMEYNRFIAILVYSIGIISFSLISIVLANRKTKLVLFNSYVLLISCSMLFATYINITNFVANVVLIILLLIIELSLWYFGNKAERIKA